MEYNLDCSDEKTYYYKLKHYIEKYSYLVDEDFQDYYLFYENIAFDLHYSVQSKYQKK